MRSWFRADEDTRHLGMRQAHGAADRADQTLQIRHGHLVRKFQGEGREHLLGAQLHCDQIDDAADLGMPANGRPQGGDNLRVGGLSHQQLLAFARQHDRDAGEQNADRDRHSAIPDRVLRPDRNRRPRRGDYDPDQRCGILKENRERSRILAAPDRLPDAMASLGFAKSPPSERQRDGIENKGQPEHDESNLNSDDRRGIDDVNDAFIDRDARAHAKIIMATTKHQK